MTDQTTTISSFFQKRAKKDQPEAKAPTSDDCQPVSVECKDNNRKTDASLPFADLCDVFDAIEQTTKRLEITDILTTFFVRLMRQSRQEDLIAACLLSLSRLGPEYEGLELGLGEALLVKALSQSTGRSTAAIKADMEERGDLGLVAEAARASQKTMFAARPLTLQSLLKALRDIARASGQSATGQRVSRVQGLLVACSPKEARYLFRLLAGKLRIGLAEQSVLIALGEADKQFHNLPVELESPGNLVKAAFHTAPNYELLVPALLQHSVLHVHEYCKMTPGVPVKPMLAFPTKSMSQVLDRFENVPFTCEFKYDGERAQIHRFPDGRIMIFSRNSENMTQKYPDLIEQIIPEASLDFNCSFVIDSEVVAFDPNTKKLLPFQILSTRKRKDVSADSVQVQVCLFAFDLLFLNGSSLLQTPLIARRQQLYQIFQETDTLRFAKKLDTDSLDEMQSFLEESVTSGCEGLMVKVRDGPESSYEPSRRSRNWLKVKKDYLESAGGDTLDLVVIGAYWGRGKRTSVFGAFLLACYDADQEEFQAVCKLGTGFSEQDLDTFTTTLKDDIVAAKPSYVKVSEGIVPDVWFKPQHVWEIMAADLSLSPIYPAGMGLVDASRGISLRFPRFVRKREDKPAEAASSPDLLADMYSQQASVANNGFNDDDAMDY